MATFAREYDQELSARIGEALYISKQQPSGVSLDDYNKHTRLLSSSEAKRRQLIKTNKSLASSRENWIILAVTGWIMFIIFFIAFFVTSL